MERGLFDSLRDHWLRVLSVTPVVAENIASKSAPAPTSLSPATAPCNAEHIYETLRGIGFRDLTFEEAYLGHSATMRGRKPF